MRHLLRSVWSEPAPPDPPRPRRRDLALLALLLALVTLEAALRPEVPHRAAWFGIALLILPALLWRRTRPLAAVAYAIGLSSAATLLLGAQSGFDTLGAMLLLPYALFRWGSGRDIVLGAAIVIVGGGIGTLGTGLSAADTAGGFTVLFAAVVLGLALRYRAGAAAREVERIRLLEREQLARELHDTVAHHVSAIAIRAQAGLATAATVPDAAVDALRVIESEAARTLTEMRAIVRALRAGRAAELEPDPGIGDLAGLARPAGGGPAVEVRVGGAVGGLPPAVGAAVYRLAQESVTNAVRHARNATRVQVRVQADDTEVTLSVRDDGAQRPPGPPGFGRLGMRERAALLGGSCTSGPARDGGGWEVTAVLPVAS